MLPDDDGLEYDQPETLEIMSGLHIPLPPVTSRRSSSLLSLVLVFMLGAVAGAALLGVRWAVRGNADPFNVSWPVYLQLGSLGLTVLVGSVSRRPLAAGFGLYFGLVAYMLVDGGAEYPVASMIALAVNGLLPALIGALFLVLLWPVAVNGRKRWLN